MVARPIAVRQSRVKVLARVTSHVIYFSEWRAGDTLRKLGYASLAKRVNESKKFKDILNYRQSAKG